MGSGRKDLFYTDNLLHQRSHCLNSEVLSRLVETVCLFFGQVCWFLFTKVSVSLLNFRWHFCAPLPLESCAGPSFCCVCIRHWSLVLCLQCSPTIISLEWSLNFVTLLCLHGVTKKQLQPVCLPWKLKDDFGKDLIKGREAWVRDKTMKSL